MTTMTSTAPAVTGGVDTHADMHVVAAVDQVGGVLGTASFPTTPAGYRRLLAWLRGHGEVVAVGVEGTGSYGAALARHLTEQGLTVLEVSRPNRQVRRRHGKTDVVDAVAAARAVLSGEATATPKTHDGPVEALRLLKVLQRSANKARTQALNQLRAVMLTAPEELRQRLRQLKTRELLDTCRGFRVRLDDDSLAGTTRLVLRELAQRIAVLDEQLTDTTARLRRITSAVAPDLVAKHGVGPDTASTLLVIAGDNPHRLHSERSFAALLGSSPIPATSGKRQNRHRLNRGGDRQGNAALWRIAMVRLSTDQNTRDYVARRVTEGKNKSEAIRCLKRYIAREMFTALPKAALV
jgi:transposase